MSQLSARSEIFLGEMGIGTQWKLRNPLPAAPGDNAGEAPPAEQLAQAIVAEPVIVQAPAPARAPHVVQPAAIAQPEPPAPAADPIVDAPAAAADDTPYIADAAGVGEDTAWFDDVPAAPVPVRAPASAPAAKGPVSEEAIVEMDWTELQAAVSGCTRCGLCATRRQAVPGRGAAKAAWLAIAAAPTAADEDAGQTISGEAGQLLDNMLKAVSLSTQENAYVTTLVKCRPQSEDGADRLPSAEEVMACRPFLEREMALSGAGMALTLGQLAAKGLLGVAARGKVHRYGALPVVATYHPDDLLRKPQDKAKAWADLCLARDARD